jgi:hypothetical protein
MVSVSPDVDREGVNAVLEVARWCPRCKKVFTATKVVGRDREEASTESPCPDCGAAGESLLRR